MDFSRIESFLASRSERFYLFILLVLSLSVLFPGLGGPGLDSLQELRVAEVAREMVARGDYIRPHYLGSYRFQKPPFAYWLCAASYKAFGASGELAARLPFALVSLLTVLLFFSFLARAYNGRAAFLGALALLSFNQYIKHARSCRIDTSLVFFLLLCAFLFYEGRRRKKGWFYLAAFAAAGFGFLAKGLPAFLFAVVVLPLVFAAGRDWAGLKKFALWAVPGLALFGLIASSWYIVMLVFDPEAWAILRRELAVLVDGSRHRNSVFYYFYQLFGALFPGFAFFLPALVIRRKDSAMCSATALFIVWFAVFFVVLSCMSSKQPHYSLLLALPVAALCGWFLDRLIAGAACPSWTRRWTDFAFYLSAGGIAVSAPIANIGFGMGYWNYEPLNWGLIAVLSLVAATAVLAYAKQSLMPAFICLFLASAIVFAPIDGALRFRGVEDTSLRTFWRKAAPLVPEGETLYHYYPLSVYVAYYMNECPPTFSGAGQLKKILAARGRVYVMFNSMEPMPDFGFVEREDLLVEKFSHKGKFYFLTRLTPRAA